MDRSPPRKKAGSGAASQLHPRGSNKNSKSKRRVTDEHIGRYIIFLGSEAATLGANSLCRQLLEIGRSHYRQFRKSGSPDLQRLTWFAIQLCAKELEKEASQ
jgi:hypothetical protein